MGSTITIIIFFSFILTGFAIEAKAREKITRAVWLPLFWMVICASRSVGQWLNLSGSIAIDYMEANLQGSIADQLVLSLCIIWGIIIIYKRKDASIEIFKNNKALIVFTIYLGITVLWSDIGIVSFRRWVKLTGNFVMAAVLVTEPDPLESIRSLFRRTAYLLIPLSVMLIKYFPQMGVIYTQLGGLLWIGATVMKNSLSHLSFVMAFYFIWDTISTLGNKVEIKYSRVLFDMIILMMSLWLLNGSGESSGAASKGSLIVGVAILIGSRMPIIKRNFGRIGILTALATCLFFALESSFGIIESIVTSMGRNMTFTDRVPTWYALIDIGMRKPFWGYGYEGFWIGDRSYIGGLSQAHNGYLEIFVEGGLVAIILLGVLFITVFRKIQRTSLTDYEYAIFRLSFFAMIILANFTESSFARERDLLTFVFYIIALAGCAPSRKYWN